MRSPGSPSSRRCWCWAAGRRRGRVDAGPGGGFAHPRTCGHRACKTPDLAKVVDQTEQRSLMAHWSNRTEPQRAVRGDRGRSPPHFELLPALLAAAARSQRERQPPSRKYIPLLVRGHSNAVAIAARHARIHPPTCPEWHCCRPAPRRQHEDRDRRVVAQRKLAAQRCGELRRADGCHGDDRLPHRVREDRTDDNHAQPSSVSTR